MSNENERIESQFGFEQSQTGELQSWEIPLDDELAYRDRRRLAGTAIGFFAVFFGILLWSLWIFLGYRFFVHEIPIGEETEQGFKLNDLSAVVLGLIQGLSVLIVSLAVIAWIDLCNCSINALERIPIRIALLMFAVSLPFQLYVAWLYNPWFLWHLFVVFWRSFVSFV